MSKTLINLTKDAKSKYGFSEDSMWTSISLFDELLDKIESVDKHISDEFKIKYIEILYKGHIPLSFAEEIVNEMYSNNHKGKHWNIEEINEVSNKLNLSYKNHTTDGDKLYAYNAFWNDLHINGDSEEKIFKDAYLFFFADDDFEGISKPFKYYKGMKL